MWRLLRECFPKARFRRQVPVGTYIVDFCSHAACLIVEVDGGQHAPEIDADRTAWLKGEGYRLVRFWNNDVLGNPHGVAATIAEALHYLHHETPSRLRPGDGARRLIPALPPRGGGELLEPNPCPA